MFTFNHFNFNVKNLEESLKFYHDALGLEEISRNDQLDFTIVFLGDGRTGFRLELTYMKGRTKPYDLGEQEYPCPDRRQLREGTCLSQEEWLDLL